MAAGGAERRGRRARTAASALPGLALLLLAGACSEQPATRGPLQVRAGDPRPVVLVVVDTLRADHVGAYGSARDTTPALDRWLASSRRFERASSTSGWTLPAFGSMFTGHLPSRHGAGAVLEGPGETQYTGLSEDLPTLAEIVREHGRRTAALVNNPFLSPEFGMARGFDEYDHVAGNNRDSRRADEMVERALSWIDAQPDSAFLLVVHLFDPHMDYDPPPATFGRFTAQYPSTMPMPIAHPNRIRAEVAQLSEVDRAFISAAYDEEIAFVDQQLDHLLLGLQQRGILEHGLTVLTSDHGEELFEHGGFEHGHALWQELLHVPLAAWGAGVDPAADATAVSLVDLAPTVLDFLDLPVPAGLQGRSLLPAVRGEAALEDRPSYAEFTLWGSDRKCVIDGTTKLILDPRTEVAFALRLDEDPREQRPRRDLSEAERSLAERTLRMLRDQAAQIRRQPAALSLETLEQLRALGYRE